MSRFDADREEIIHILFSILDYARLGYDISTYNSCNDCGEIDCHHKPKCGDQVRWNCPLWVAERRLEKNEDQNYRN